MVTTDSSVTWATTASGVSGLIVLSDDEKCLTTDADNIRCSSKQCAERYSVERQQIDSDEARACSLLARRGGSSRLLYTVCCCSLGSSQQVAWSADRSAGYGNNPQTRPPLPPTQPINPQRSFSTDTTRTSTPADQVYSNFYRSRERLTSTELGDKSWRCAPPPHNVTGSMGEFTR